MSKDLSAGLFASRSSCISCCVMYNAVVSARLSKHPCRASVPVRASDAVFQGTCNAKVLNATFAPCQGASNWIQCSQHVIHCLLQIEVGDEIFSHASRFTLGKMDQPTFWFVRRPGKSVGSATSNLLLGDMGRLICRYHAQSRANVLPTGSVSTAATAIPSAFALAVGVQLPRPASYAPPMSAFSINGMVLQEAAANGRLKVVAKRAGTPLSSPFDGLVQPESPKAQLLKSSNSLRASFGVEWRRASVTSRRPAR
ncbi:hypothetical protein M431DRAFT_477348 [Trichoderma harzianum CBS 226.95]|uniref:Uncharacterized protein n=1 Tax=Trichoderma harzianum CBS 226.95 TaxID=983964 RepID=A0A2T4AV45_TRIHA|nr:hypothetical protein M431DRAFT_477348 [Trichoderma harzianum CBS 226.95]PTB60940.1 hypothetical protein M431DRAFT_477348 [Trichoderma harzianum CBS 226.95]